MEKFANYETPDFQIMKEAILAFQLIVQHQIKTGGEVTETDRKLLY